MNEPKSIVMQHGRCHECGVYGIYRFYEDGSFRVIVPTCWHKRGEVEPSRQSILKAIAAKEGKAA